MKDLFGFEELERKFIQMQKSYPNEVSSFLRASAKIVAGRAKQLTNKGKLRKTRSGNMSTPGGLKKSWRVMGERYYVSGGTVTRFVRVASTSPHAHLVNLGHELWVGGQGKVSTRKMYIPGRGVFSRPSRQHINSRKKGKVEGKYIINRAKSEYMKKFGSEFEKVFDKLTKEVQI